MMRFRVLALLLCLGLATACWGDNLLLLLNSSGAAINAVLCDFTTTENPVSCGGLLDTPIDSDSTQVTLASGGVTQPSASSCTSGHCGAWYTGALGATQESFLTVSDATGNGTALVWVRLQDENTATPSGYLFIIDKQAGTDAIEIRRFDSGSPTAIASGTQEINDGDKICLNVAVSALTAYIDSGAGWVEVLSTTDATYATGTIGYTLFTTDLSGDNFGGGDGGFACVP